MKKLFMSMLLLMAAIVSAGMLASCSGDDPKPEGEAEEEVVMGKYSLYFPEMSSFYWPDSQEGITEAYELYKKNIVDALGIDVTKEYKWSEIQANAGKIQAAFDQFGDFVYKVKAIRNYLSVSFEVTLKAYSVERNPQTIDFGEKKVICQRDIEEDVTSQFFIEITSYDKAVPSAKDYNESVRKLFTEALKEVFGTAYGVSEVKYGTLYSNLANYKGTRADLTAKIKEICDAVAIPELPENIKADVQAVKESGTASFPGVITIDIFSFDVTKPRPITTQEYVYSVR